MRKVYLESVPASTALERLFAALVPGRRPVETVPAAEALGRVTARPVMAAISSPHYHASAMDGIAVRAGDTFGAAETAPVALTLGKNAFWVDTGDPLPPGCDAVIMVEELNQLPDSRVEIIHPAVPWQHVRSIGEDLVATEMVVPEGTLVRPAEVGALLAAGISRIEAYRRPVVTFIPTGNELVEPRPDPGVGELIEFNSRVVLSMVGEWGGQPVRHAIVRDDRGALREAIGKAVAESDVVIVNAGSSAGSEDYTCEILAELGDVLAHGIAIKPGKPAMLGVCGGKPVMGLPGYPVSTWLTADLFFKPVVYWLQGHPAPSRRRLTATLSRQVTSPMGVDDFIRVKLGRVGDRWVCSPMGKGAGVISSLVRADGLLVVPAGREGCAEGQQVEVELLRPRQRLETTVLISGTHDMTLDLMDTLLRRPAPLPGFRAHTGSLGGLVALKRGEAHMAAVHLLDETTGEYNDSYVRRYYGSPLCWSSGPPGAGLPGAQGQSERGYGFQRSGPF